MRKKWSEQTTLEKSMNIVSGIALCAWLVFEMLTKKTDFQYAELCASISILIVCVCEAFSYWNVKRTFSYVAIGGAVLILLTVILTAMLVTQ